MDPDDGAYQDTAQSFGELIVSVWTTGVFGVDLGRILAAALVFLLFLAFRQFIAARLRVWIEAITRRTATRLDDKVGAALAEPLTLVPALLGAFFAFEILALPGALSEIADALVRSGIAFVIFWALIRLTQPLALALSWVETYLTAELTNWFVKAIKIALWLIGAATILEIWGIRVLPIIAGFGLIGVAVALGAQDLFKNLISGVLILAERRFRVGDWIKVDGVVEGTVEAIGFRSTKVRRFDKAPVYVPNARFADGAVTNYGEMTHRRVYWSVGLEYRATAAQLAKIREEVERYILEDGRYLSPKDASMFVRLDAFSDSSVDLLIYCFTKTRNWGEWLVIKEDLLLKIKQIVEDAGAGFAFPSRSLYVEKGDAPVAAPLPAPVAPSAEPTSAPPRAAAEPAAVSASAAKPARKPRASASKPSSAKPATPRKRPAKGAPDPKAAGPDAGSTSAP